MRSPTKLLAAACLVASPAHAGNGEEPEVLDNSRTHMVGGIEKDNKTFRVDFLPEVELDATRPSIEMSSLIFEPATEDQRAAPSLLVLTAGNKIPLVMTQEVTTKGRVWSEGDVFELAVKEDILVGDTIVIPAGTPAKGRITWLTSKGVFGKSGKMDIELEHLLLDGEQIAIDGTFRQKGSGNTLPTIGGVVATGIFTGLIITGTSAKIPEGRELTAILEQDLIAEHP